MTIYVIDLFFVYWNTFNKSSNFYKAVIEKTLIFSSLVLFQRLMSKTVEFKDLTPSLLPEILDVLQEMNFKTPTPVQGKVIPYFLSHKDVNVSACTGSGKTLSFLIPVFQIIQSKKDSLRAGEVGGIVISPTRELAMQTYAIAQQFKKHLPKIQVVLITGGIFVCFC